MKKKMANFKLIQLLMLILHLTWALYEDQVGKFDWKRSLIGKIKFSQFYENSLVVATEDNILASLSISNGSIIWRQFLENSPNIIELLHVGKETITVSGSRNSIYIRSWDTISGILLWEWTQFSENINLNSYWFCDNNSNIYRIMPILNSHIEITEYPLKNGENNNIKLLRAPWIEDLTKCRLSDSYFACFNNENFYYIDILSSNITFTKSLDTLIGSYNSPLQINNLPNSKGGINLKTSKYANVILLNHDEPKLIYTGSPNSVALFNNEIYQFDIDPNDGFVIILKIFDPSKNKDSNVIISTDYPLSLGAPNPLSVYCSQNKCVILILGSDNSLSLFDISKGRIIWTREEALSHIVAIEFFDLPISDMDASIENEFLTTTTDILSNLINRLSSQLKQLTNLLFGNHQLEQNGLVRDEFGLHKIIIVATSVGKLFGIDTISGTLIWSYRIPNIVPFKNLNSNNMLLLIQRTTRFVSLPAHAILIAKDSNTGKGILFHFNPITGLPHGPIQHLNYKIKQSMLMPDAHNNHLKPIIIVNQENYVELFPSNSYSLMEKYESRIYFYFIENENILKGYCLKQLDEPLTLMWNINFGTSKIILTSTRPDNERVHSQGRVLPDRSVYYKYVNPNLIAIATLSEDIIHKNVLSIYLIDGITGFILYSTCHKKVKAPFYLVHSENWIVYTFFNERYRRNELVAAELFEGHIQSNRSIFSSYAISQLPQIKTQSYILPLTPQSMTVTLTERGITNKFLLIALTNGAILEIPWILIQPRFSDMCTPDESCIPYMPELPMPSEATINYNQTLIKIKGIHVSPAQLESNIHVLVHGMDLFYTRVAPSKTFDMLKDDFDHRLIVLVLFGLLLVTYVTKYLASRKALKLAWK